MTFPFDHPLYEPPPCRTFRLKLRLPNSQIEYKAVEKDAGMSSDMFNALCVAVAQSYDSKIEDIQEIQ